MVGHPRFGAGIDPEAIFNGVLSTTPAMDSVEVIQVMTDIYETRYGIFNHFSNIRNPPNSRRPLANVAFHPGEDFTNGSLLEDTMKIYRDYPIYDIFKIDYPTFMSQPCYIVDMMVKIAKEKREKEHEIATQAARRMDNASKEQNMLKSKPQVSRHINKRKP